VALAPNYGGGCNRRVAITGDLVVAASHDGRIFALDKLTGAERWSAPQLSGLPSGSGGNPLLDDRPLAASAGLILAGSLTGYVAAYDASTGAERWRSTAARGSASFPLSVDGEKVYVVHLGLQMAAFDLATGTVRWIAGDINAGGEYYPAPAIDAERVYVGGVHGLYALRK
jgi:outer membrane protein assembly factor BamB